MKIEGRITRIMPTRSGTSQQSGNQWKALPFVFSFYDDNPRYEDSVLLETFDTNIMAQLAQFVEKGPDGKAIEENGSMKLNVLHIPCKVGFGHRVRYGKRQDGTAFTMNEVRLFEFELMTATNGAGTVAQPQQPQQPFMPQPQAQQPFPPAQEGGHDDLPF